MHSPGRWTSKKPQAHPWIAPTQAAINSFPPGLLTRKKKAAQRKSPAGAGAAAEAAQRRERRRQLAAQSVGWWVQLAVDSNVR